MPAKNRHPTGTVLPATGDESPGLRERKKEKMRVAISEVATQLFLQRGFEHVTVAEIAAAAEVSVTTVFNYFATKDELFFARRAEFATLLSRIIRERKRGETPLAALRRAFRRLVKGEVGPSLSPQMQPYLAMIDASPSLQAHARGLIERGHQELAATLLAESAALHNEAEARALASMVIGLQSLILGELRNHVLAGASEAEIRAALSKLGESGFTLLLRAAAE